MICLSDPVFVEQSEIQELGRSFLEETDPEGDVIYYHLLDFREDYRFEDDVCVGCMEIQ